MPKDYLGMRTKEPADKEDHGIKGQRWGVRRSAAQLKTAITKRAAKGEEVTPTAKAKEALKRVATPKPAEEKAEPAESSAARYERLKAEAKSGKAASMTDADLKFFNARTEAIAKITKATETQPNWLATTLKDVAQNTFKQQLQNVASTLTGNFINEALAAKNSPTLEEAIAKQISDIKRKDAIEAGVSKAFDSSYVGTHRKPLPGNASYVGARRKRI